MKIAHIAPARRMPKGLGYLSYTVPSHLESHILPGQLVTVEIKKSHVYGIVFSISETDEIDEKMKPILSIVQPVPLFSNAVCKRTICVSELYGISIGTAVKLFLPPLQTRKLTEVLINPFRDTVRTADTPPTFHLYNTQDEHHQLLRAIQTGKTIIITPDTHHIHSIAALFQDRVVVTWHSELSQKEQFARWFQVRNGEYDVIIGSRSSIFLPFESLDTIIIDEEHSSQHKQWEGHPLYHMHDLTPFVANTYGATIHTLSYSPRFETYFGIAKEKINTRTETQTQLHTPIASVEIIDMQQERKAGNDSILSEQLIASIQTVDQDTLVYVQRKGFATAATCHHCNYTARCNNCGMAEIYYEKTTSLKCHYCKTSRKIPPMCPECNKESLHLYGVGTEQVVSFLETLQLPGVTIIRSDGNLDELEHTPLGERNIIVGTESMFRRVDWSRIRHIIWLDIDAEIQYPDYRASEQVWHTLKEFRYRAPLAVISIQTYDPSQLLLRCIAEPERLYRTELHARQALKFPPYTKLVRLSTGGTTNYAAEREAERVFSFLSRRSNEQSLSIDITYPIATYPTLHRGRYWYTILLKLDTSTWNEDLTTLTKELPSSWRIDPSPQSLLSP